MRRDIVKYELPKDIVIENDHPWGVDIDDTLLLWDVPVTTPGVKTVTFLHPTLGYTISVVINENNLLLMKEKKGRGCFIVLWSQGGYEYGRVVRDALNLQGFVDLIMTKPVGLIDDLPSSAWLPSPVNIPHTKNYKTTNTKETK